MTMTGKCVAYGKGCARCVPTCDGDGDGFCPPADCRDNDRDVHPANAGGVEICGNGTDDDCDGHIDEACKTCMADAECTQGLEACLNWICDTCSGGGGCDPAECRFGRVGGMPGSGVAGRCASYGTGCQKCVPACDSDGDGFCPGNPGMEQPGGDCNDANATVLPDGPGGLRQRRRRRLRRAGGRGLQRLLDGRHVRGQRELLDACADRPEPPLRARSDRRARAS